jgi:hypothetical protein
VYVLNPSTDALRAKERLSEYNLEMHEQLYKPIQHIQVKQTAYFEKPSTWGKTSEGEMIVTSGNDQPRS